ncbi:MAG: hypothetical protein KGL44_03325 [Sphingomonadales bacterium]|nr:hypothetical protein [Sphingomonadales bacterium]
MKKVVFALGAASLAAGLAVPAQAGLLSGANLINVAKVVLGNRAVLNKGVQQCPNQVTLQPQDDLLMTSARAAVQRLVPASRFGVLETAADTAANRSAASPEFCQNTATKKPGLLGGIADAARKMGVGGGILGPSTGTATTTTGSTPSTAGSVLGGILGGSGN